jgi:hypothetical protein
MARSTFSLDAENYNRLYELMKSLEGQAPKTVNEILWNEGGPLINEAIINLLPVSGRRWKGKKPAAKSAAPFTQENDDLSVTLKTKSAYNYLYFPDDGTNTKKHVGEQYFMFGGAEAKQQEIIDRCVAALIEKLGG